MPLVSIVVPVHNTAPYLEECVNSLLAQTIADRIEIIHVENASTDDSPAICRALAASHPATIRLLTLDRGDLGLARNEGAKIAVGKYIGFIDSDDTVEPNMFEQLVTAKESHGADISYCNFAWVENGEVRDVFHSSGNTFEVSPAEAMSEIITGKGTSSTCVRLYNRSFFNNHSFPEFVRWEDHQSVYRWMTEVTKIVHVDNPLYHYYQRTQSLTHNYTQDANRTLDLLKAESARIPFVWAYEGVAPALRKATLTACVQNMLGQLVRFISDANVSCPSEAAEIRDMRRVILHTTRSMLPWQISLFQWIQLQRLRFGWTQFVKRQVHRANGK